MSLSLKLEELLRAYYTHFPDLRPPVQQTSSWRSATDCWNAICEVSLKIGDNHETMNRLIDQLEVEGIKKREP